MGEDKEETKGKRREQFKRLWRRSKGDHEISPSTRASANEVASPDNGHVPSTPISQPETVASHSSEQIKQDSPQIGLWARAADSLDQRDREKLDKLVARDQASPPSCEGDIFADYLSITLEWAKKLKMEGREATYRPVVDNIIKGAVTFKSVGDTAVKFDKSGYAALGWSVVSFGLLVAVNAEEAREFVLTSSEVITRFMAKYRQYERIFRGPDAGEEFDQHLVNVYKATLLYTIALNEYLNRSGLGRLAHATLKLEDRSISSRKKDIDTADAEVSHWLLIISQMRNDGNFSQIRMMLQGLNPPEISNPLQECLRSLSFPGMDDRFNDIERAAEGTCKWLLGHETYRDWTAGDCGMLCIKGKPGSGKSTLLRYAVGDAVVGSNVREHSLLLHSESLPRVGETGGAPDEPGALILSFFFHDRGAELQKTTLGLFRSLLHQVLRYIPEAMPGDLLATFQDRKKNVGEPGEQWHWHWRELQEFFRSALSKALVKRPVCLLIDALDEYGKDNANELIKSFNTWIQDYPSRSHLRICFSCRHHPRLALPDSISEIRLESENEHDISTYVGLQLSAWPSSENVAAIQTDVTSHASGVFIWARLIVQRVLDLQREGENWIRIREEVEQSPIELDDLYRGLIEQVADKSNSLKLIQWICFAMRPLSWNELRWAMVVEPDLSYSPNSLQHYETTKYFASDCDMMEKKLTALSCGLAEIVPSSRVVQFIHQSVKNFFLKEGMYSLQRYRDTATSETNGVELEATAHCQLSKTCIRYLSTEKVMQSKLSADEMISEFPLLHYAASQWIAHAQQSEENGAQINLLSYFGWPSEAIVQHWAEISNILGIKPDIRPPLGATMLHVASRHRLMGPLLEILQRKELLENIIDAMDEDEATPLWYAVHKGHEAVVRLLLENGADANASSRDSNGNDHLAGSALKIASISRSKIEIVRVLLENGANVNARDKDSATALQAASENGQKQAARLLLENGADVNAPGGFYGNALIAASTERHEQIVEMLLENGADVNARGERYGCALTAAITSRGSGSENIVRLLLEKGADVNAPGGKDDPRSALQMALDGGRQPIVQILQKYGAV